MCVRACVRLCVCVCACVCDGFVGVGGVLIDPHFIKFVVTLLVMWPLSLYRDISKLGKVCSPMSMYQYLELIIQADSFLIIMAIGSFSHSYNLLNS